MSAIDAKPAKPDLSRHPRLKRTKPKPAPLSDDAEARLLLITNEKEYREILFRDFVKFCREHDGFVVSQPWHSPALVLVPLRDGETSRLEIALQRLPKYRVLKLPSTAARLSHGVSETMRQIEVTLWRPSVAKE
jgi:hypothetical protein